MTMTDVEISGARPAKAPNTKAAVAYLVASGATAISIVEIEGACAFRLGHKIDPNAISVHWLNRTNAMAISRQARKHAGVSPDAVTAGRALSQAAADHRQTLTPHDVAIERAGAAADRLDAYLDGLRGRGTFREFNRAFKARRKAAVASGTGFISYKIATARLRRALIPLLVGGQNVGPVESLFAKIFGSS
jgi:hypothetical protein